MPQTLSGDVLPDGQGLVKPPMGGIRQNNIIFRSAKRSLAASRFHDPLMRCHNGIKSLIPNESNQGLYLSFQRNWLRVIFLLPIYNGNVRQSTYLIADELAGTSLRLLSQRNQEFHSPIKVILRHLGRTLDSL